MLTEIEPTKVGAATIYLNSDGCFDNATLQIGGDYQTFLTLDLPDMTALYRVCEQVFGHWDEPSRYPPDRSLWSQSSFRHFAPLFGKLDTFWISVGPLNSYVKSDDVKAAFLELKSALDCLGGIEKILE